MRDNEVGFIGIGNVGSRLANSILESKYKLNIYDINKNNAYY